MWYIKSRIFLDDGMINQKTRQAFSILMSHSVHNIKLDDEVRSSESVPTL